jgi:hypothetical protein
MRICSADEGLHRISDAKPISRNTITPHAAVTASPVDGRIFERQVRLLQLKMPLRVELVQRRVREQATRQCKLRVAREHVQIQPAYLVGTACAAMENDCMNVRVIHCIHVIRTSFLHFGELLTHTANFSSSVKNLQIEFRSRLFAQS